MLVSGYLFFLILLVAIVLEAGRYSNAAQAIGALSILVTMVHAVAGLGWREAAMFVAVCLAITFAMENIGVATGFPFGSYQFELHHLPRIGAIPIIVGPLYLGMGYLAWIVASLICQGRVDRPQTIAEALARAAIAAFVMTQWDCVMDPGGSTLAAAWTWQHEGGYFGVPLSNFLGWLLTTATFFLPFSFYQYARRDKPAPEKRTHAFWLAAVLLYLASGFSQIAPFLFDESIMLIDRSGRGWLSGDLRETAVIVMIMTMLPSSLMAIWRLYQSPGT